MASDREKIMPADWEMMYESAARELADFRSQVVALTKERDELQAAFDWLDAMPIMEQMERTIAQSDGSYPMWRIKRTWGEQGEGKTLREAIRAAREKEKA